MIDALLSLIPGGSLTAIIAGVVAALGIIWRILAGVKKSGVNQQKVKEAEARAKNLDRIKRAADARPDPDIVSDPRNRDNRR